MFEARNASREEGDWVKYETYYPKLPANKINQTAVYRENGTVPGRDDVMTVAVRRETEEEEEVEEEWLSQQRDRRKGQKVAWRACLR